MLVLMILSLRGQTVQITVLPPVPAMNGPPAPARIHGRFAGLSDALYHPAETYSIGRVRFVRRLGADIRPSADSGLVSDLRVV